MGAAGIILADGKLGEIDELIRHRTVASVPFGGRYRLVDFALSNFVNADVMQVGIITKRNYQSLMDHIGSGKDWDLSRKNGGVIIFPPYGNPFANYQNSHGNLLEALQSVDEFITKCPEDHIIVTECDSVNVIDYSDVLSQHEDTNADITVVYKELDGTVTEKGSLACDTDEFGRLVSGSIVRGDKGLIKASIGAYVIKRKLLAALLKEAASRGSHSFEQDLIINNISSLRIFGYNYVGAYLPINSMEEYYKYNMALLDENMRSQVFEQAPIYTKVRDSAPTKYGRGAKVQNSFIADGCEIEGTVVNSILFRGVKVSKGTVIKDSILMQDTMVMENVKLKAVITDKNVTIKERQQLSGCEKLPYYIGKNMVV